MRVMVWFLVVLTMVGTPATAQDATPLMDDPSGDVQVTAQGQDGGTAPAGTVDRIDLLAADVQETVDAVEVEFTVVAIEQDADVIHRLELFMDYAGARYVVGAYANFGATEYFGRLSLIDEGTGRMGFVDSLDATTDAPAGTVHVTVPRDLLVGADGAPLVPGRSLESMGVLSTGLNVGVVSIGGETARAVELTDEAGGDLSLELVHGVEQTGDARLASPAPFRSSNGEASTFVYPVQASNLGDAADGFALALSGVPAGWDVELPTEHLRLEAGETRDLPVVVRTPFVHSHGSLAKFLLTLTSDDGADVGRVEMGIRYPTIPQPAGHHDTLWIHPVPGPDDAFTTAASGLNEGLNGRSNWQDAVVMNAVEADDRYEEDAVQGYRCDDNDNGTTPWAPVYCWDLYLDPGLDIGLDFDLGRTGTIEVPVHALVPTDAARLTGTLVRLSPPEVVEDDFFSFTVTEPTPIADVQGDAVVDIGLDGEATLTATITPRPDADLVPYERDAGLVLVLALEADRLDSVGIGPHEEPELLPGGRLTLPLLEYSDPVDEIFAAESLRVEVVGDQERLLNPGATAVFAVDVSYSGDGREALDARLVGTNVEWADLLGPDAFRLEGNQTQRLSVSITAPEDAADEDVADVVLEVASASDLSQRSLVRFLVEVDTDEEHPDDAAEAKALGEAAEKDSPGVAAPLLLAVLGALALVAARRRP